MSYPKPLIYFRRLAANLPVSLLPSNLDPAALGVQISSIGTFTLAGTPSAQFALIGKGPQKSPASSGNINVDNVWSLQGCEVRIYLDNRANTTASFDPAGEANCPLVFTGDVHEIRPSSNSGTPWYAFACEARGLIARAERVPVVSPIDNGDTIRFNINALLDDYQPTTAGKSVGQAIAMTLTTYAVAYRLHRQGIGNFTLSEPNQTATLPTATIEDLGNITLTPPFEFRISGDNVIAAIQQTLDAYAPNFTVVIQPDGTIRFPDLRNNQSYAIDLIGSVVDGLNYTKSTLSSYSRVLVRGGPKIVPYYCQWNIPRDNQQYNLDDSPDNSKFNGNIVEHFDYTGNNNTLAKINYNHTDFTWGRILLSVGNATFTYANTTSLPSNQIQITPSTGNLPNSNTTNLQDWADDELTMIDAGTESRRDARIKITRSFWQVGTGGNANSIIRKDSGEFFIVKNTAANSTVNWSILTTDPNVDRPPAHNSTTNYYTYDYELYGYTRPGSTTWRRYKINLDAIGSGSPLTTTQIGMSRRLGNIFPMPVDGLNYSQIGNSNLSAGVNQQRKTWYPEFLIEYRQRTGNGTTWNYQAFWADRVETRIDPVNSQIILSRPSVQESGNPSSAYTEKLPPWDNGTGNTTDQPFQIVPFNVKVLLPVYEGTQEAVYPHYNANMVPAAGESNATVKTVYGMERDLIVSLPEWYDARDQASADQYAKDLWDTVEKPLIQGGFAWVDGIPDDWSYAGVLSDGKLQSFTITANETCSNSTGSGIEECTLLLTACEIKYPGNSKPFTVASFTTARPRIGIPMHDFHSFEEMLTRDAYII